MQKKKNVLNGILIALVLVIGLVLYSEKVNKIEIVDNVKNVLSEQIQKAINVLSEKEDITEVDVTGLVMGQETEHEHLWKTMYDENKHWEECTVCGEISNEVEHTFETMWTLGTESCNYSNFYTKICTCGYSETGHKPCVWDGKTYVLNPASYNHYKKCTVCKEQINYSYYLNSVLYEDGDFEDCILSNGENINCLHLGICVKCGYNYTQAAHSLNGTENNELICRFCNKQFGTYETEMTRDSNTPGTYTILNNISLTNGATFSSASHILPNTLSVRQISAININSSKTQFTLKSIVKSNLKDKFKVNSYINVKINNINSLICIGTDNLSPDLISPEISSITMDNSEELIEWSRTKPIVISGTENYCNTVRVKIEDNEENIIFEGDATVTNSQYSIACTPDIEASEDGRVFKAIVTDACENSTEQEFTIAKVDSVVPEATSGNEILGDWAQSKDFTFTATDYGIGNVSIAFNDVEDYELATKDGETYSRNYRFVGDAYNPTQARVFYKDELGNVSTQVITIDKIDNTAPTITNAKLNNNKLVIESNDEHPELGEGSGVVKYRYLSSDTKLENPTVTEGWKEADSNSEIVIENVDKAKYIYIVAEDLVGNVGRIYELEVPALVLDTEVNLEAANGKGGVDLDWSTYDATNKIFKAYQKKENSEEWETISTFDFYSKGIEPINVLNVYPPASKDWNIPTVNFTYLDGTSANLPKSAALKVWMEGGTMTEGSTTTTFNSYGKNPITGEQIIKVTPISGTELNNNPDILWDYDIVMFGIWDGNGWYEPDENTYAIIEKYIQAGYGILGGHDTIGGYITGSIRTLNRLRKYFNIEIGNWTANSSSMDRQERWGYGSTTVEINKKGTLTNFPYELSESAKLVIPFTHTTSNASLGNTWISLTDGYSDSSPTGNNRKDIAITNYKGIGNPCYYLTTWNNTAMIQTGSSNCASTDDERKILANTLFYLKQRTTITSFTDNSSQDLKAPDAPTISAEKENQNIKVNFNSNDNGSTYSFYVEAYDSNDASIKLATSNQRTETVTTGTKGYYYIIDEDSNNTDFDITAEGVQYTTDENIILDGSNNGKYIHMKADDVAENVSESSVIKIEVLTNVTVNLDGGKIGEKDTVELEPALAGKTINLDELGKPEKEGYRFCYWEATIGNINGNEYTYPIQDDVITAIYEKIPDLILNTEVNLEAANGKGGVDLDWKFDLDNTVYKAYQKKEDSEEWETISTYDFYDKDVEPIKVLNIYQTSGIHNSTYTYADGTNATISASAGLKVWMEGGTINGTSFKAYGKNPITGKELLKVTSISNSEFNRNPDIIWNYDVVAFGFWDNGDTISDDKVLNIIEDYIKAGYGILGGHTSIMGASNSTYTPLRKYFNIEVGNWTEELALSKDERDYDAKWGYMSNVVEVNKKGLITTFPYELPVGTILTIANAHTVSNAACGNVWMTLKNGSSHFGDINKYYNEGGKGNPCFYLTTYNNTAMIQTGHLNDTTTDDERKILANTLFYLKQRTTATSFTDNSSQDLKAPDAPTISAEKENQNIKVNFNSEDNGSTYSFYVEAYDSSDANIKLATSNQRTETVTTGTKGYYYIIDEDSENTDFDVKGEGVQYTTDKNILLDKSNNGKYIHMKAEDVAGNISEPSVLKLDVKLIDLEEKITMEVTKKWVDNNIQALRRPNQIKFIVTQYKDMAEYSVLANEEVVSNEDTRSTNSEKIDVNNIKNQTEEKQENTANEVQEESNKDTTSTDKESNSAEEVLKENKTLENAYSNEILKSSILPDETETINPNSIKVENETAESMQKEQVENDNNETENVDSKLDLEESIQDENSTQQDNELERATTNSQPEEGSKIPDETTNNETVNSISEETSTTPEREEVEILIYEYTMTVNKDQDSQVYIIELPKYDKETEEEIKYIITEEEVNEGDLKFYEATGGEVVQTTDEEGNVKYTAEIVNIFKLPENNVQNITATKVWNDNNNKKLVRPTSIVLELIGKVENIPLVNEETLVEENTEIVYKDVILKKQSLSSAGNWKHVFTGVPIYDENGQEIEYSVREDITQETLDKYISDVSKIDESNEITVTNSLIVQDSKIEKTGTEEINAVDSKVNYSIDYTYELDNRYAENAKIEIVDTLPYEIDETKSDLNGGTYSYNEETKVATITWTGIYNSTDRTIIWDNELDGINVKVAEDKEKNVYIIETNLVIGVTYKDIQIATEKITNKVSGKITLSNDVTDLVEDIFETGTRWVKDVVVNKLWKGDTVETRPDSITTQLVSNVDMAEDIQTTATITPTQNEEGTTEWTYTWSELPTYDAEGKEIKYTVDETAINYTKGEQTVENEYYCEKTEEVIDGKTVVTLTNIKYGSITVEKVDSRKEEIKLPRAEFKLEKMIQDEVTGEWIVPEETNEEYVVYTGTTGEDGTYTFEGLKYGHYKLTETKAPEDYKISEKDIDVIEVNEENADVEVTIGNIKMYKLPITGGIGVDTIRNAEILAGIVALILITNRKKVVPERRSKVEAKKIKKLEKLAKKHKIKEL